MDAERLEQLGQPLAEQIGAAIERGDWQKAVSLGAGLAREFSNSGMTTMVTAFLDELQPRYDADNAEYALRIQDALAAQHADEARRLLAEKSERHRKSHELYVDFMARIMSAATEMFGAEGLHALLRGVGERAKGAMFEPVWNAEVEKQVEAYAFAFRGHMGKLSVSEDDEKFSFLHDPCGSGGRLMRQGYYEGEDALVRVSGGSLTLDRDDFPVYCTHCPVWLGQQHQEWFGAPMWVLEPPLGDSQPCRLHIYKDKSDTPDEFRRAIRREADPEPVSAA